MSLFAARGRWLWLAAFVAVAVGGLLLRLLPADRILPGSAVAFTDNDTVRRLARLRAIDQAGTYPVREVMDGFPDGCVSHWTRPMDWLLRGLDPLCAPLVAAAAEHEAAAVCAGPLLALVATAILLWGAGRLLGPGAAVAAGLLHTLSYAWLDASWLGNGDHQTLQHVLAVGAWLAFLAARAGARRPRVVAAAAGALAGLGVWVSVEMQLFVYVLMVACVIEVVAIREQDRDSAVSAALAWAIGLAMALVVGHLSEHPGDPLAFCWDQVSWFQLQQALVFFAWVAVIRWLPRPRAPWLLRCAIALGIAVALGLAPALLPAWRAAFFEQLALARDANTWVQGEVWEFMSPFRDPLGAWTLDVAFDRFSWLLPLFPVLAAACAFAPLPLRARSTLVVAAVGTFALASWEYKLGHFLSLCWPIVIVVGGRVLVDALAARVPGVAARAPAVRAAAAACAIALHVPTMPRVAGESPGERLMAQGRREIIAFFARRNEGLAGGAVLARWGLGAHLMYYARVPVLASGYHRNVRGIQDGYRILLAGPGQMDAAARLLRERRVRYVVAQNDRAFLATAPRTIGRPADLAVRRPDGSFVFPPATRQILFWRLRYADAVPGFRLLYQSSAKVNLGMGDEPLVKIFAVED